MFVADLHNDLVQRMMIGEDVTKNTSSGHNDIERLKLSSIDLEVMIVWASEKEANTSYFDFASKMYDKLKSLNTINGVSVPVTLEDIKSAKEKNELSLPIGSLPMSSPSTTKTVEQQRATTVQFTPPYMWKNI